MSIRPRTSLAAALAVCASLAPAPPAAALEPSPLAAEIDRRAAAIEPDAIQWRRHLHEHPELSGREVETARFVAERLRALGIAPRTGVAKTGVVAVIEGGLPGPVVALRADMDALPVAEQVDLPFASHATGTYEGHTVPVMHACGHDAHTAILLAAAQVLQGVRERLPGKVVLLFQPAEEGVPAAEGVAGAEAMIQAGVLSTPKVDAVFGLHVWGGTPSGRIEVRSGPLLAAADSFEIVVHGRQTHGSRPWDGVDPIAVGAEIVGSLQQIVARNVDLTNEPAVVSVGQFEAGVRSNIIPETARLVGTIRTFDEAVRRDIHARVRRIAENVAEAHGARAEVTIETGYPVTINDPALLERMRPTLDRVAAGNVAERRKITGAEDFSLFAREAPGLFLILGATPPADLATAAPNHSPRFFVDEATLVTGIRALSHLAADYLFAGAR